MHVDRGGSLRMAPAILAALAVALAFGMAGRADAAPKMGVVVPDPGHVSFAVSATEVRADKAAQLPKRVKLGFRKASKLPESVRVVWATRVLRKGRRATYATAVLILNQASTAARPGKGPHDTGDFIRLLYDMFVTDSGQCDGCRQLFPGDELHDGVCDSCHTVTRLMYANPLVDEGSSRPMRKKLTDLFEGVKEGQDLIFEGSPQDDPSLETGHYDDGHAFGWGVKTKRDERDLLDEAADAILRRKTHAAYLEGLEAVIHRDLNGDGVVGSGQDGSGSFTRHPQCEFVADPSSCTYLKAAVSFKSSFQAFQIEIPGYRVQPGELTGVFNEGGAEIGSCSPFEPTVVHCNLDFALGDGAVVTTQVEPATAAQPEGVRLPDGTGGQLFKASPSPNVDRLSGPFPMFGP